MKKFISAAIVCVILLFVFVGCAPFTGDSINVTTAAQYDEAEFIKQMAASKPDSVTLAESGVARFVIVYPTDATGEFLTAIGDMRNKLSMMIGDDVSAVSDAESSGGYEICLGNTNRTNTDLIAYADGVKNDGYAIKYEETKLFLYADSDTAATNAIYGFLEDKLGCVWLDTANDYIPQLPTIVLKRTNEICNPDIVWRSVYGYEQMNSVAWKNKLKLNGVEYANGREAHSGWGTWCHTFFTFLNPDDYYESHPEYFSLRDGVRVTDQLCLSNAEVYEIVRDNLKNRIVDNPDKIYWDVSIMDVNRGGCECAECSALDNAEGSGMGSLLPFINRLAEEFPDVMISTLAYFHTVEPPKTIKPRDNVIIKLCSMPGDQASSYPLGATKLANDFKKQVEGWSAISKNLFIWDYTTNFSYLLMPFPNFAVQKANTEFYLNNNVYGVFHQSSREYGGEMAELRAYILAKLMWDIDTDVDYCMSKYLTLYYGKEAGKEISNIMQRMSDELYKSGKVLGLYDVPSAHKYGYLSESNVNEYFASYNRAVSAAGDNEIVLNRLERYKISLLLARMYQSGYDFVAKEQAADEYFDLMSKHGITSATEIKTDMATVREWFETELRLNKLELSAIILCPILAVVVVAGIFVIVNIRRKKKQ